MVELIAMTELPVKARKETPLKRVPLYCEGEEYVVEFLNEDHLRDIRQKCIDAVEERLRPTDISKYELYWKFSDMDCKVGIFPTLDMKDVESICLFKRDDFRGASFKDHVKDPLSPTSVDNKSKSTREKFPEKPPVAEKYLFSHDGQSGTVWMMECDSIRTALEKIKDTFFEKSIVKSVKQLLQHGQIIFDESSNNSRIHQKFASLNINRDFETEVICEPTSPSSSVSISARLVHFIHRDCGILSLPLEAETTLERAWEMFPVTNPSAPLDVRITSKSVFRDIQDPPSNHLHATFQQCGLSNDDVVEFITESPNDGRFLPTYANVLVDDYPSKRAPSIVPYEPGMTVSRCITKIMAWNNRQPKDESKNVLFHFVKQGDREFLRPLFYALCLPFMEARSNSKEFENDCLWLWSKVEFVNEREESKESDVAWPWDHKLEQWTFGFALSYTDKGKTEKKYFLALENGGFRLKGSKTVELKKDDNPLMCTISSIPSPTVCPRTSVLTIHFFTEDSGTAPMDNVKIFRRCDPENKLEGSYSRYTDFWVH